MLGVTPSVAGSQRDLEASWERWEKVALGV